MEIGVGRGGRIRPRGQDGSNHSAERTRNRAARQAGGPDRAIMRRWRGDASIRRRDPSSSAHLRQSRITGSASAHGPVPAGRPTRQTCCSAGRSSRPSCSRSSPPRSAGCGWCGGIDAAHPANPVPRRRTVAFLGGLAAIAVALMSGIDALRHDAVLGPHGPARAADAGGRAAPRAGAPRSPCSCGLLDAERPALGDPARPPLAGRCGSWLSRSWPGSCSRR